MGVTVMISVVDMAEARICVLLLHNHSDVVLAEVLVFINTEHQLRD